MRRLACVVLVVAACGDDGQVATDAPGAETLGGRVSIRQEPGPTTTFVALFGPDRFTPVSSRDEGPCRVSRTATSNKPLHRAGEIRISTTGGAAIWVVDAGVFNTSRSGYQYAGGETLVFEAMAEMVPGFTQMIPFPHPLTVLTTSPSLRKSQEFTATWTPTESDVLVRFSQGFVTIDCTFAGTLGTGTIAATTFSDLVTELPAQLVISTYVHADVEAGDYAIDLDTYFYGDAAADVAVRE